MAVKKILTLSLLALFACKASSDKTQNPATSPARISAELVRVTFLGDSLTEGFGVDKRAAYPALVEDLLNGKFKKSVRAINAGISGSTSASAASRMNWILKSQPDAVVLALGANDGLRGLSVQEMEKNLSQAIDIALKNQVKVFLIGMRVPPNYGADYSKSFEDTFLKLSKKYPAVSFMPFLLEGVGGEKKLNLPDGIHPNEEGHKVVAQNVAKFLAEKI